MQIMHVYACKLFALQLTNIFTLSSTKKVMQDVFHTKLNIGETLDISIEVKTVDFTENRKAATFTKQLF